ncbi:MAG: hypothetical protein ACOWWR_14790 [Eubacteriales bacterium]
MKWLWKLEKAIDKFAIRNLMMYIAAINLGVYLFDFLISPILGFSLEYYLAFHPELFLQGQVWRMITFIFIPPTSGLLAIFVLYFYYMIGSSLEQEWGTAKFNLYYFFGMMFTLIGSFITGSWATPIYLNLSLFLAFAQFYPDFQVLLFFILPIKIKYLAYLNWAFFGYTIIFGSISVKVFAVVSLLNFFLFFSKGFFSNMSQRRQYRSTQKNYHDQIREFKRKKR